MRWLHVRFDVKWPVQHRSGLSIRAHIFLKWNQNVHTSLAHILRSETYHMGDVVLLYGFFFVCVCSFGWESGKMKCRKNRVHSIQADINDGKARRKHG